MEIVQYENYQESKKHGEYAFPYTTYICTIPLDFCLVPLHWHEEIEFIYIKKGQGIVTVDLATFQVRAGSIIFILPGQLHSIYQEQALSMEYENILIHPSLLISSKMDSCSQIVFQPLFSGQILFPTHFTPQDPYYPMIAPVLDACDEISDSRPAGYQLLLKSKLFYLFYIMNDQCRTEVSSVQNRYPLERMKPVLKYIELHYDEAISIACIAKEAACSESHFMRIFKETFGHSFVDYLKDYRLTMAARLLRSSDETVLMIASEVGFENLSYFNRSFKAKYGMTPGKYRRHPHRNTISEANDDT